MKHTTRTYTIAVLAALAASLLSIASAQALSTNNPQWKIKSGVLGENEKLPLVIKAKGPIKIQVNHNPITCKSLSTKEGKGVENDIVGSKTPNPGTGQETLVYNECDVEKSPLCMINGESSGNAKIETEQLKDTLVYTSKTAAEHEESKTLTLVEPKGKVFAVVKLSGTCPEPGEAKVEEGKALAENDNGEELKEVHTLSFPDPAVTTYFKNASGKTEEVKIASGKELVLGCFLLGIVIVAYVIFVAWGFW